MKVYEKPTLDYIQFDEIDIITTSGPSEDPMKSDLGDWDLTIGG